MLFRTLLAPFVRGLAPRPWVVPLIMGVSAAGQFITGQRQRGQYRSEVEAARKARGDLFAAVGPRVAGLEGLPPSILHAAGRGLPPAPPPQTNLFQQAMQIAGAYSQSREAAPAEAAPAEAAPAEGAAPAPPPPAGPQAQMGAMTEGANVDPAASAEQAQAAAGAGQGPPAQMGAMTEDQAATDQAMTRDLFTPEQMYALG